MGPQEEREIIRREYKRRGRRNTLQLLHDIRRKLTRKSGWAPHLDAIASTILEMGYDLKIGRRL